MQVIVATDDNATRDVIYDVFQKGITVVTLDSLEEVFKEENSRGSESNPFVLEPRATEEYFFQPEPIVYPSTFEHTKQKLPRNIYSKPIKNQMKFKRKRK